MTREVCRKHKRSSRLDPECPDCRAHADLEELREIREAHRIFWCQVFEESGFDQEYPPDVTVDDLLTRIRELRECEKREKQLQDEVHHTKRILKYTRKILKIAERDYLSRIDALKVKLAKYEV